MMAYASTCEDPLSAIFGSIATHTQAAVAAQQGGRPAGARCCTRGGGCGKGAAAAGCGASAGGRPIRVDIIEHKDGFEVVADLPGVPKEAIDIKVEDESLTITVTETKKEEPSSEGNGDSGSEKEGKLLRTERFSHSYTARTLTLPRQAELSQLAAKSKDGVLRLVAPKKPEHQPRAVPVE